MDSRTIERLVSKPHWYMTFTRECPGCGRVDTSRERHYEAAPPKEERYFYNQSWCGCCYE